MKVALSLLILLCLVSTVSAQVTVTRDLPDSATVGETFKVTLNIKVGKDVPAGVIIEEKLPEGLSLVSSSPEASVSGDKIKWALYGDQVKDTSIEYTLRAEKAGSAEFNGSVTTILGTEKISGDSTLEISEKVKKTPGFELITAAAAVGVLAVLRKFV